jgi:glutathione synthase/RimK-type ligase-like ATP-grasp enzyme
VVLDHPGALDGVDGPIRLGATQFLTSPDSLEPGTVVLNLCSDGGYLSTSWYVSLLAEARGARPVPEPALLEQARDRAARDRALREEGLDVLDAAELTQRARILLGAGSTELPEGLLVVDDPDDPRPRPARPDERFRLRVLAGRPAPVGPLPRDLPSLDRLARRVFAAWPLPLTEVSLVRDAGRWRLVDLTPVPLDALTADERRVLGEAIARLGPKSLEPADTLPSLAVLWDGADPSSASSAETIDRLARVALARGLRVERIGTEDLDRLGQHDALWIRVLTGVDQPAWRFATRAEALGMPVMDHPSAIVRCSNKVFVHELLRRTGLATPRTRIFGATTGFSELAEELGTPVIVKVPDGSFSSGVYRVATADEFQARVPALLERTPLLVAQEYLPTSFDWRIGVLDGRVLYAARYHMVRGHWQIRTASGSSVRFGRVEAVPRDRVPPAVLRLAAAAALRRAASGPRRCRYHRTSSS